MVSRKIYPCEDGMESRIFDYTGQKSKSSSNTLFPWTPHLALSGKSWPAFFSAVPGMARDSENPGAKWRPVSTPSELKTLSRSLSNTASHLWSGLMAVLRK